MSRVFNWSLNVASVCFNKSTLINYYALCRHSIPPAAYARYVCNHLSSIWQDAWVPVLVPETQSLRNSKIRWFCADPFSSLAQTFAVNGSRGAVIQTELCGLELECHGKMFPPLLLCFSLYLFYPNCLCSIFSLGHSSEKSYTWQSEVRR